jgi:LEA14-like dessication related protein
MELTRRRVALLAVASVVVALVAAVWLGVLGAPSVAGVENRFGPVTGSETVVETDLLVDNPNPFVAGVGGLTVSYAVDMNDVRMAEGTKQGLRLGRGTTAVPFETAVDNEKIPAWWVSHVRNDEETTLVVNADVSTGGPVSFGGPTATRTVETDLLSAFDSTESRPVNANAPVVSDPVLVIEETSAEWETVTANATPIRLRILVRNPNSYPVGLVGLEYDVGMNGVQVGEGTTGGPVVVPAGETRVVETTATIRNEAIDDWWVTHLRATQRTTLRIDFTARFELGATTVRVPLDPLTYTRTFETDIFGTKPATGARTGSNATGPTPDPSADGN